MAYRPRYQCLNQHLAARCTKKHLSQEEADKCSVMSGPVRLSDIWEIQVAIRRWTALYRSEGNGDRAIKQYWMSVVEKGMK